MSSHINISAVRRGRKISTINEDSPSRGGTKSPKPNASGIEIRDFKDTSASTKRRSTHPQFSRGPASEIASADDGVLKFIRSATLKACPAVGESNLAKFRQRFSSKRPESNEGIVFNGPRRQSTLNTNYSVISNASASFEETAVWDQKAVLALGMIETFPPQITNDMAF